jgi:hypothetical protein
MSLTCWVIHSATTCSTGSITHTNSCLIRVHKHGLAPNPIAINNLYAICFRVSRPRETRKNRILQAIEADLKIPNIRKAGKQESRGFKFSCFPAFIIFDLLHSLRALLRPPKRTPILLRRRFAR